MADEVSIEVMEKASRLLAEHRVVLLEPGRALVCGDSGQWVVTATPSGVVCSCPSRAQCSHCLAAMARWEQNGGAA